MQKTKRESGRNNKSRQVITTQKWHPYYKEQEIKRHISTFQLSERLNLTIFNERKCVCNTNSLESHILFYYNWSLSFAFFKCYHNKIYAPEVFRHRIFPGPT
jgi:hypothetical protein